MQSHKLGIKFVEHSGVKGMHWGVRKASGSSGGSSKPPSKRALRKARKEKEKKARAAAKAAAKRPSEDYIKSRTLMAKKLHTLSNQEIQAVNNRLQLETKFSELSPSRMKKGRHFLKEVSKTGKAVSDVYNLTKTPLGQDLKKRAKKKQ